MENLHRFFMKRAGIFPASIPIHYRRAKRKSSHIGEERNSETTCHLKRGGIEALGGLRILAGVEAFLGLVLMAVFTVTFARKLIS